MSRKNETPQKTQHAQPGSATKAFLKLKQMARQPEYIWNSPGTEQKFGAKNNHNKPSVVSAQMKIARFVEQDIAELCEDIDYGVHITIIEERLLDVIEDIAPLIQCTANDVVRAYGAKNVDQWRDDMLAGRSHSDKENPPSLTARDILDDLKSELVQFIQLMNGAARKTETKIATYLEENLLRAPIEQLTKHFGQAMGKALSTAPLDKIYADEPKPGTKVKNPYETKKEFMAELNCHINDMHELMDYLDDIGRNKETDRQFIRYTEFAGTLLRILQPELFVIYGYDFEKTIKPVRDDENKTLQISAEQQVKILEDITIEIDQLRVALEGKARDNFDTEIYHYINENPYPHLPQPRTP